MVPSDHTTKEEIAKGRIAVEARAPACIELGGINIPPDNEILVSKVRYCSFFIDVKQNADDLSESPMYSMKILFRNVEC